MMILLTNIGEGSLDTTDRKKKLILLLPRNLKKLSRKIDTRML